MSGSGNDFAPISCCRECGKPLVIHTTSASADTLRLMREERADEVGGVMHCFTETWDVASAALISAFTSRSLASLASRALPICAEVAKRVLLNRMLIETDAPYLAPVPFRGKRNEPSYVPQVAAAVAAVRETDVETIGRATSQISFPCFRWTMRRTITAAIVASLLSAPSGRRPRPICFQMIEL